MSDIGEPEPDIGSDDMEYTDNTARDNHDKDDKETGDRAAPSNMFQMMNQIQSLIKLTVEKAKQEEKISNQKSKYIFFNF